MIHPTAIVSDDAKVGDDVFIGPYSIIEKNVELKKGVKIDAHAIIRSGSVLEDLVKVDSFAVIGGPPQDLSFDEKICSGVRVGKETVIREGVTIHRSTRVGGYTIIGDNCLLMGCSHIAHDCHFGNRVILANGAMFAGHASVGDDCFVGGSAVFHQFIRIGEGAMIGGNASISKDVPPFVMATERNLVFGLNLVGLKRRGFKTETIKDLKNCYNQAYQVYQSPKRWSLDSNSDVPNTSEGLRFKTFFEKGDRGFVEPRDK